MEGEISRGFLQHWESSKVDGCVFHIFLNFAKKILGQHCLQSTCSMRYTKSCQILYYFPLSKSWYSTLVYYVKIHHKISYDHQIPVAFSTKSDSQAIHGWGRNAPARHSAGCFVPPHSQHAGCSSQCENVRDNLSTAPSVLDQQLAGNLSFFQTKNLHCKRNHVSIGLILARIS